MQDDAGNFYVADYGNFCVKKVTPSGTVSILAGSGSPTLAGALNATGTAARFTLINSIAIDTNGNIYVAEWGAHGIGSGSIRKITLAGEVSTYYTYPSTAFVEMFEVAVDVAGECVCFRRVYIRKQNQLFPPSNNANRKCEANGL